MKRSYKLNQPISNVKWIDRNKLKANNYNPNKVQKTELELLKESIKQSGWTQPIVIREDFEIVDGFHRWTVSGDKDMFELTEGKVPCVVIENKGIAEQMMATVRHNRARGSHAVAKMSDIVADLVKNYDFTDKDLEKLLGMEDEEVARLVENGSVEYIKKHAEGTFTGKYAEKKQEWIKNNDFSESWEPTK